MTRLPRNRALDGVLALIAVLAILLPLLLVRFAPPIPHRARAVAVAQRVVPKAELPPVEPVAFQDLDPDDARAFNAEMPFVAGPNPAARPFRLIGDDAQRARAIDCMAAALLYEAGDDTVGQRAVAQVVINRVRHPAFPKTICGMVFQGSERATGCQFTFTCDGALVRHHWADVQWTRARATATAALSGKVFARVGYATHYHTDWVAPYWQASLDKIAAVDTHLFFRWTGWWGTPPAFNRRVSSDEPEIAALAAYSAAHRAAGPAVASGTAADGALFDPAAASAPLTPALAGDANTFLLTLDADTLSPDGFAQLASRLCGDRAFCKVLGWTDKAMTPTALPPQPAQLATMAFSYLRDRAAGFDKPLWNCAEFRRPAPSQCMKQPVYGPVARSYAARLDNAPGALRPPPVVPTVADGLAGVRRKTQRQTIQQGLGDRDIPVEKKRVDSPNASAQRPTLITGKLRGSDTP